MPKKFSRTLSLICGGASLIVTAAAPVRADGGVVLRDVTPSTGINYARKSTPVREADRQAAINSSPIPLASMPTFVAESPQKWHGAPGVAIFDFDRDGDLDIYAPNGPDRANSLYSNQLKQTGQLTFVDVAAAAGVTATEQDSSGVCFGDLDNDGDQELLVLGSGFPNILYENNGNGTFTDITQTAGVGGANRYAAACSMADVNNDGLLDIAVANTYDGWLQRRVVFTSQYETTSQHDYLFLNTGGNEFLDVSQTAGFENTLNVPDFGSPVGNPTVTWAIAMVDIDQDGDADYMGAEDTGAAPQQQRGIVRLMKNDGAGNFADKSVEARTNETGGFMGFSYSDFNCDGHLDFFVTDLGRFMTNNQNSRWFLGQADGKFVNPGVGALGGTPFGWGTSAFDYDNDGDDDIYYQGGVDILRSLVHDNPGVLLRNDGNCTANFSWAIEAIDRDHRDRIVEGVAAGDLNNDGFTDVVSISEINTSNALLFRWIPNLSGPRGTVFDPFAAFNPVFFPGPNGMLVYNEPNLLDGDLVVEVNSADNGNKWVQLNLLGAKGLISNPHAKGRVNRDGIGAIVHFTPQGGKTVRRPVLGGSSYASQDSLTAGFGLGSASQGVVEVMWPGGTRNRLYDVAAQERLVLPEIPCDFVNFQATLPGNGNQGRKGYEKCVKESLKNLTSKHVISQSYANRIEASALRAYDESH